MRKTIIYLLIFILGIVLGTGGMFLFTWQTNYLQGTICPKIDVTSPENIWQEVEFPEYENPFEETIVNPFEEVYTNPFEKLEAAAE